MQIEKMLKNVFIFSKLYMIYNLILMQTNIYRQLNVFQTNHNFRNMHMLSCQFLFYERQQTYSNMKTFNHYVQHTHISTQLQSRMRNYIKESATMKKQTNLEEQRQFMNNLPESFKLDMLRQSNQKIWKQILFFKNFSEKMIQLLSIKVQKVLAHPQQIIYKKNSMLQTMIFQSGGYSFLYKRPLLFNILSSNGKQVQKFKLQKGQHRLLSLNFLFGKSLNFDVKSNDYTVIYKLSNQNLIECLKNNPYDYEYYCMMRDKDSILINQFQVNQCQICLKQKHTLFLCPKLHYLPLKEHLIRKYIKSNRVNQKFLSVIDTYRKNRKFYSCLKDLKQYKENIIKYRCFLLKKSNGQTQIMNTYSNLPNESHAQNTKYDTIKQRLISNQSLSNINQTLVEVDKTIVIQNRSYLLKQQIQQIYKKVLQKPNFVWQLQTDNVHNFKYYLKKYNCENILKKKNSKTKKVIISKQEQQTQVAVPQHIFH